MKGMVKWIGAGIGIAIGVLIVLLAIGLMSKDEKDDPTEASQMTAIDNSSADTDEAQEDGFDVVTDSQNFEIEGVYLDDEVPKGYKRLESGGIMVDNRILGMQWETVEDENTRTVPRVYEPFTIYSCKTENGEQLRMDVVNSDIGYMLKFYFGFQDQPLKLQAQQATEEAHYKVYENATELVMRSPDTYYALTRYENGDTMLVIKNAISGRMINHFACQETPDSSDNQSLINQMVPEHFNFKPMTEDLQTLLEP